MKTNKESPISDKQKYEILESIADDLRKFYKSYFFYFENTWGLNEEIGKADPHVDHIEWIKVGYNIAFNRVLNQCACFDETERLMAGDVLNYDE